MDKLLAWCRFKTRDYEVRKGTTRLERGLRGKKGDYEVRKGDYEV